MTACHAKYFAHELTKRCPSDSVGKLAASLADAQVDLNPHQIDAALFAFRSLEIQKQIIIVELGTRNSGFFEVELDKPDRWGEDRRASLKAKLKDLEDALKIIKRQARLAANLPLKLKLERECRNLETNREEAWKEYEGAARDIEKKKDALIDEVEKKLTQSLSQTRLFSLRWRLI